MKKITMKMVDGQKTIFMGENNDATVYAVATMQGFEPINPEDLEHVTPDFVIKCDSGVYPGITNFEQYICDKAFKWFNAE